MKDGRQRNDEPQSASRGDSGEAEASSSGSGDGSSEQSSPTGSESEDSSSDDESLQEALARSTGPSHPEARIDPKPGGVKPRELLRAANCGFTFTRFNTGIEQPSGACAAKPQYYGLAGTKGACQSFKVAS